MLDRVHFIMSRGVSGSSILALLARPSTSPAFHLAKFVIYKYLYTYKFVYIGLNLERSSKLNIRLEALATKGTKGRRPWSPQPLVTSLLYIILPLFPSVLLCPKPPPTLSSMSLVPFYTDHSISAWISVYVNRILRGNDVTKCHECWH